MLRAKPGDKIRLRENKERFGILIKVSKDRFKIDWGDYTSVSFNLNGLSESDWEIIPQNRESRVFEIAKWCKKYYV